MVAILGERTQENIDRLVLAGRHTRPQLQCPVLDRDDLVGRVAIDVIGLDGLPIDRHRHRHRRVALQNFAQRALAIARQVRHDDETQAGVGRQVAKEQLQRLQSTGRSADADDGKVVWGRHWTCRSGTAPIKVPHGSRHSNPCENGCRSSRQAKSSVPVCHPSDILERKIFSRHASLSSPTSLLYNP
jgi:hypothetical protein